MKKITTYEYNTMCLAERNLFSGLVIGENYFLYFQNGKKHHDDGPAFETKDGYKQWWSKGELHRIDGPAKIYPAGVKNIGFITRK